MQCIELHQDVDEQLVIGPLRGKEHVPLLVAEHVAAQRLDDRDGGLDLLQRPLQLSFSTLERGQAEVTLGLQGTVLYFFRQLERLPEGFLRLMEIPRFLVGRTYL